MVLKCNANTAFTDWKIKDYFKQCCDISGGTWSPGGLAQAPVVSEFGKKKAGFHSVCTAIQRLADGQWQKGDRD